jgi:hypothetical protein
MHDEHGFTWFSLIPGLEHAPGHIVGAILVALILVVTTALARSQLIRVMRTSEGGLVPEPRTS